MSVRTLAIFLYLLLCVELSSGVSQEGMVRPEGESFANTQLPMVFEPNQGQAQPGVRFLARGSQYGISLEATRVELLLATPHLLDPGTVNNAHPEMPQAVSLELVNANKSASVEGNRLQPGKSNYFIGNRPADWISGVPQYAEVDCSEIYPGVNLRYYGRSGKLEYDFVLSPGADPSALALRVRGVKDISLSASGNASLQLAEGTIDLELPLIYQEDANGNHQPVPGHFVLRPKQEIGFVLGAYDPTKSLVIDPVLSYSTLIGANTSVQLQGIAVGATGDAYVVGSTYATNYPVVAPLQATNAGYQDAIVTKLSPAGDVILYSTYLGGGGFDSGLAIAVDSSGDAYVTGSAEWGFPTTPGAFMTNCPGSCTQSPFVTKILSDGKLGYSTYMGGDGGVGWAIAVDSSGAAYITGVAGVLPLVNPFQSTPAGAFLQKLSPDGGSLTYSTYLGGGSEVGRGIAVDSSGSAYVVGNTSSPNFPVKNAIQQSPLGLPATPNAFVTKFTSAGDELAYSTFLGGSSNFSQGDFATGIAVDSMGNAHVTGTSDSCDFPLMLNALSTDCASPNIGAKMFVLTLNPTGSQLLFSTFLRSAGPGGIAVDAVGNSYVAGSTLATDYPLLNAIETTAPQQPSSSQGFVSEFDLAGKLLFSTYLGGTDGSLPVGIALDKNRNIYVAGQGQGDFPLLHPIASQVKPLPGNGAQIFIAKISPKSVPMFTLSPRLSPFLTVQNVSSLPLTISAIVPSANFTPGGNCKGA
jgi:hypothetical protein